jgi:hypothetical protein
MIAGRTGVAWLARISSRAGYEPVSARRTGQDDPGDSPARESLNNYERLREVGPSGCYGCNEGFRGFMQPTCNRGGRGQVGSNVR